MPYESVDHALKDLKTALDVRPSGAFAARVLQAVATRPMGRPFRTLSWAAVALTALVAAVALMNRSTGEPPSASAPSVAAVVQTPAPTPRPPIERSRTRASESRLSVRIDSDPLVDFGDVLVPADQLRALRALLRGGGAPSANAVREVTSAESALSTTLPIQIPPIVIEPMPGILTDINERRTP